jgi:hypothetical protein
MANDVIIERVVVGRYVKVTAVDPATGTEVMIIADASAPPAAAAQIAARKLMRQLEQPQQ